MALCAYLLPLRRLQFFASEAAEWASYFESLSKAGCEVIIIDGSPPEVFSRHAEVFGTTHSHIQVDRRFAYLNDKVNAVHTGVAFTDKEKIILADDDIRYTAESIRETVGLLEQYEVVRPQNFLSPLPWWARIEASRMLINRGTLRMGDYPGTCAFRRSTMLRVGHYDGDVLFDNEEIIRHFAEKGATIAYATDLFIRKRPPHFRKWMEQRARQAYEDFGLRIKTSLFVSILPLLLAFTLLFGLRGLVVYLIALAMVSVGLALRGLIRGRAREVMPLSCCLFAPMWVVERSISTYAAAYWFIARGGYPFGDRLLSKGIGRSWRKGAPA